MMQEIKQLVLALKCQVFYIQFYYHQGLLHLSKTVTIETGGVSNKITISE